MDRTEIAALAEGMVPFVREVVTEAMEPLIARTAMHWPHVAPAVSSCPWRAPFVARVNSIAPASSEDPGHSEESRVHRGVGCGGERLIAID